MFEALAGIDDSAQLYLRPIHFTESPQHHGEQTQRLAGGMLWFASVELIAGNGGGFSRHIVPVAQWDQATSALPEALAHRAQALYGRIIAPRTPVQMGQRTIRLDQPQVMGILNMTPDSFSDGGQNATVDSAAEAAIAMSSAGASIIDIGGESTRPGAKLVWEGDEIERVCPVIERLSAPGTAMSIDTRKAAVMEAAITAGARMVNDISALLYDERALDVVKATGVPVILMHAPSQDSDPHKNDGYRHVVTEVFDWLEARVDAVEAAGISRDKILIDPGLGFGKSLTDNLAIINNLALYHAIGCPIVFGASRKRMIGALSNEASADARLGGSVFLAMKAAEQGAQIVRVHDVPETVQALHVWRGLRDAALTAIA
ncbi:dihydropteroate synthase [Sphingorhabdus arenilitoris]|uniref:dihydropteroate synthase n=1 Tax=Sphingorhabdus arenilitoris TaxID=1490041 RepID=A0ABV8RHM7_9SPHN